MIFSHFSSSLFPVSLNRRRNHPRHHILHHLATTSRPSPSSAPPLRTLHPPRRTTAPPRTSPSPSSGRLSPPRSREPLSSLLDHRSRPSSSSLHHYTVTWSSPIIPKCRDESQETSKSEDDEG
ncbi:hypothetical protein Droror1_Dr00008664 [Drosera rotundifolia]